MPEETEVEAPPAPPAPPPTLNDLTNRIIAWLERDESNVDRVPAAKEYILAARDLFNFGMFDGHQLQSAWNLVTRGRVVSDAEHHAAVGMEISPFSP